jgi:hypothetical protein
LGEAVDAFMNDHTRFPNVFTDGGLKREDKQPDKYKDTTARYICENGLETIFQKCFLSKIIPDTSFGRHPFIKISVSETHGTALADFTYKIVGDTTYGFQFQDGTFKIQIAALKTQDSKDFLKQWEDFLPLTKDKKKVDTGEYGSWTLNESKEGKKSYLSISRPKKRQSKKNPVPFWYEKEFNEIRAEWDKAFEECKRIMDTIILKK